MSGTGNIAVILNAEAFDSQALLEKAAARWSDAGIHVAGLIAGRPGVESVCSAGTLRDIASGDEYSVALDAPPEGTSCHLDSAGMQAACAAVLRQIQSADTVILSKFGKLESTQKGLWAAFAAAADAGKPILTTVSTKHLDAWRAFAPEAVWLQADSAAIEEWRRGMMSG